MRDEAGVHVLVLDDDADFCELLCELLETVVDGECVVAHSVAEMIQRADQALSCELAILDVNLGAHAPTGIDAYAWLRNHRFAGEVVFLTGHARLHPDLAHVSEMHGAAIYEKPLSSDLLVSLFQHATHGKEIAR